MSGCDAGDNAALEIDRAGERRSPQGGFVLPSRHHLVRAGQEPAEPPAERLGDVAIRVVDRTAFHDSQRNNDVAGLQRRIKSSGEAEAEEACGPSRDKEFSRPLRAGGGPAAGFRVAQWLGDTRFSGKSGDDAYPHSERSRALGLRTRR